MKAFDHKIIDPMAKGDIGHAQLHMPKVYKDLILNKPSKNISETSKKVKRAFRTFLFEKFDCETIMKQLWQSLELFCTNFDSLRPRNHKIIAILFPLDEGETLSNITKLEMCHNRSK